MIALASFIINKGEFVNLIPITSRCFVDIEALPTDTTWSKIFGNDQPLALEIGCGTGHFAVAMAQLHPEWNFIAVDYYNKGCLKTSKRADKAGLDNLRVIRAEACSFIEHFIPAGSLCALFINCPDPWPKKRHRKRRLVNIEFVSYISKFMQPDADFFFATDFVDYGEDVANFMPQLPDFENLLAPDFYRHELEGYPLSKYMLKFMALGKQIYFVNYRKKR